MIREAHIAALLAKAKEAQEQAEKATDAKNRERWRRIAETFRELAKNP